MASNFGKLDRDLFGSSLTLGGKQVLDTNRNLKVNDVSATKLQLKPVVGLEDPNPSISMKFKAYDFIGKNHLVKVSSNEDFRVEEVNASDDTVGVIGVSTKSAHPDDVVNICTDGIFTVELAAGIIVNRGDRLIQSNVENGTVTTTASTVGVFGVSLQSAESPAAVDWIGSGGDSDFNESTITFPAVTNVSSMCFNGDGYAHSHEDALTITISLWDGTKWIVVSSDLIEADKEVRLSSLEITFPTIPSVTQLRLSSNPFQNDSFHNMDPEFVKFTCVNIKGCFVKNN